MAVRVITVRQYTTNLVDVYGVERRMRDRQEQLSDQMRDMQRSVDERFRNRNHK